MALQFIQLVCSHITKQFA